MCVGDGAILTKDYKVLKHPKSNSHEDIVELHHLEDIYTGRDREWLRIELHPQASLISINPDEWQFILDADGSLPDWYNLEMAEKYTKEKLMREIKEGRYKNWGKSLTLGGCTGLKAIPELPSVESLTLDGCTGLKAIPELPSVKYLYLQGCTGLKAIPELPSVESLDLRGCTGLKAIPELPSVEYLDLGGCTGLKAIPELPSVLDLPEHLKEGGRP
jgi:hypothetical protein